MCDAYMYFILRLCSTPSLNIDVHLIVFYILI